MSITKLKKLASERLPILSAEQQDLREWEDILLQREWRAEQLERRMQSNPHRHRHTITKRDILNPKKTSRAYHNDSHGAEHYADYNPDLH